MPVGKCKWCGANFTAISAMENTCSTHCSQMWRREHDRARKAKQSGRVYEPNRDASGRVVRRCVRCTTRLSSWNRGHHCHPCWESMSLAERKKHGRKGDAYEPEPDLRRERNEILDNEGSDTEESLD
jgi:hypothetical protein